MQIACFVKNFVIGRGLGVNEVPPRGLEKSLRLFLKKE
jgi:hypothetical protein